MQRLVGHPPAPMNQFSFVIDTNLASLWNLVLDRIQTNQGHRSRSANDIAPTVQVAFYLLIFTYIHHSETTPQHLTPRLEWSEINRAFLNVEALFSKATQLGFIASARGVDSRKTLLNRFVFPRMKFPIPPAKND